MAEFALAKGKTILPGTIQTIESIVDEAASESHYAPKLKKKADISRLVTAHDESSEIFRPATPQTILLLDVEQETTSLIKFLGPVGLVRQMMCAALISLAVFVNVTLSDKINQQGGSIFTLSGIALLVNLLLFLSAAGLGASFAGLYKANQYITDGTFGPAYSASYWIRFFLGLISGLMLAVLIAEDAMHGVTLLEDGVIRPLLAIVGGFSADLLYTFLSRMVESLKSLFEGSAENLVDVKTQEMQASMTAQLGKAQIKLQQELMDFQQEIGADISPEAQAKVNALVSRICAN